MALRDENDGCRPLNFGNSKHHFLMSTSTTGKEKGSTTSTAINAEPLLTPSNPGSAIGLRKALIITPAVANAAPSTASKPVDEY